MAALIPVLAIAALYGWSSRDREVEYTKATVDGRRYLVLRRRDAAAAANLLAMVRADLQTLVQHVVRAHPDDPDYARLARNFDPDAISEGAPQAGYTSYTINKVKIVLCIRQSDGSFVPKNVIMYVGIHELAHAMTASIGHTPAFWEHNARLLEAAKSIGVFEDIDFAKSPQSYCGICIRS